MVRREPLAHIRREQEGLITQHRAVRVGHAPFSQTGVLEARRDTPICNRLYDVEIRRVLFSTNAIESLNARYRRAVGARGHFPTEQAALKCLYLVTRGLDPKGTGQARWTMRWKPALNAFAVTFADRMPAAENL